MKPVTLLFFFIIQTYCRSPQQREGRWFGYTYTSTITKSQHVTSLIPSSCVQYAATLPPCRNVRSLDIPEGRFLYINSGENVGNSTIAPEKRIGNVSISNSTGWGHYLGLMPPTVTVTNIRLEITRMIDPGTVLTFSVSGCKPSKLPLDLPKCPENESITPTSSIANIQTTTIMHDNNTNQQQQSLSVGETQVKEQTNGPTETLSTTPRIIVEEVKKT